MLNTRTKELIAWEVKGRAGPWGGQGEGRKAWWGAVGENKTTGGMTVWDVWKAGSWGMRVGQEERPITGMWWGNKRLSRCSCSLRVSPGLAGTLGSLGFLPGPLNSGPSPTAQSSEVV